jgi:UDP-N-acetylglucosamine 1-carboxyvinyltransferase
MTANGERSGGRLVINGGRPLGGAVQVPGTKHGTVLAFAAAVAAGARLTLRDAPAIADRFVLADIVRQLGGSVAEDGAVLEVDGAITGVEVPRELAQRVHGSLYMLPAVLANRGEVVFHGAGGDRFGRFERDLARPVQHMLDVMAEFGARGEWRADGSVRVEASRLTPAKLNILRWSTDPVLPEGPQVSGASKTALLMAAAAPGTSIILHPHAREAQHELIAVLRALGVHIEQRDACWLVTGGGFTPAAEHRLMPCPVEFATWQAIAAVTGAEFTATCADTSRLVAAVHRELDFLAGLHIRPRITPTGIEFGPAADRYPGRRLVAESTGISTDITPLLALVLGGATGESTVADRIWGDRFDYAAQLSRLGANMTVRDGQLRIVPAALHPTTQPLTPNDTRSAAVCVAAALAVPGRTVVHGLAHLDRGYGSFAARLRAVGADVTVTADEPDAVAAG